MNLSFISNCRFITVRYLTLNPLCYNFINASLQAVGDKNLPSVITRVRCFKEHSTDHAGTPLFIWKKIYSIQVSETKKRLQEELKRFSSSSGSLSSGQQCTCLQLNAPLLGCCQGWIFCGDRTILWSEQKVAVWAIW